MQIKWTTSLHFVCHVFDHANKHEETQNSYTTKPHVFPDWTLDSNHRFTKFLQDLYVQPICSTI